MFAIHGVTSRPVGSDPGEDPVYEPTLEAATFLGKAATFLGSSEGCACALADLEYLGVHTCVLSRLPIARVQVSRSPGQDLGQVVEEWMIDAMASYALLKGKDRYGGGGAY